MNRLSTLSRKVKKAKDGLITVTSTIEATMSESQVDEQLDLLAIHKQKAEESLSNINRQIDELLEIKKQLE